MKKLIFLLVAGTVLSGCAGSGLQSTSGTDYLAAYQAKPKGADAEIASSSDPSSLDALVKKAAAVEPSLTLPARIGLARIERQRVSTLTQSERSTWSFLSEKHAALGYFMQIDDLLAQHVADDLMSQHRKTYISRHNNPITKVRLAAARHHLDAVLVYAVETKTQKKKTVFSVADITLVGGGVLPTRSLDVSATAKALLIDVRSGYPYFTATGYAEASALTPWIGWTTRNSSLQQHAEARAVEDLAGQVDKLIRQIKSDGTTGNALAGSTISP